jgi:hypothetical protein
MQLRRLRIEELGASAEKDRINYSKWQLLAKSLTIVVLGQSQ